MRNGTYTRWTRREAVLDADILGEIQVSAKPDLGTVSADVPMRPLSPDEARLIGVRLIEAATLADGERAIRSRD